jgi:hypothetical protein
LNQKLLISVDLFRFLSETFSICYECLKISEIVVGNDENSMEKVCGPFKFRENKNGNYKKAWIYNRL